VIYNITFSWHVTPLKTLLTFGQHNLFSKIKATLPLVLTQHTSYRCVYIPESSTKRPIIRKFLSSWQLLQSTFAVFSSTVHVDYIQC